MKKIILAGCIVTMVSSVTLLSSCGVSTSTYTPGYTSYNVGYSYPSWGSSYYYPQYRYYSPSVYYGSDRVYYGSGMYSRTSYHW